MHRAVLAAPSGQHPLIAPWSIMSVYDVPLRTIDGRETTLAEYAGKTLLIVNVASKCGSTPQYSVLEQFQLDFEDQGFTVLGFPCNQFGGQEPGTAEEIAEFCSTTYGVTFPLFEKIDVNGPERHPLYDLLVQTPFADGSRGDIGWNFEKFVVSPDGDVVARFKTKVQPDDPDVISVIKEYAR
jgi:glutathione peroxidase